MKVHQTFKTIESNNKVLAMKCPKQTEGCLWKIRVITSRETNKWIVTKWGGRHTCINAMMSQDHDKLRAYVICDVILGISFL